MYLVYQADLKFIMERMGHNDLCENGIDLYVRAVRVRPGGPSQDNGKAMGGRGKAAVLRGVWLALLGCTEENRGTNRSAVESRVGCIGYALGFRRMLRRLHIKLPTTGTRHSMRSPRSRIDLAEKPIPRHQTYAEPRFRIRIERLGVRVGAIFAKSALNIWIRIRSMQRFS
jgi:hypothetical protein